MTKNTGALIAILFFLLLALFIYSKEIHLNLKTKASSWTQFQKADCGVVLTGGSYRIQEGFDLLSQDRIKNLIIAGVHPGSELYQIFPLLPLYGSVNEKNVILEKYSKTTFGNAQQSLQLIEALQCRDIILITSKLHMRRAFRTFKAVYPNDFTIYKRAVVPGRIDSDWTDLFVESTKSLFYSAWAY